MDVDIWSDIACPWCYIGKRRFEQALERFEHRDQVTVHWRSFELDPEAPDEYPGGLVSLLTTKYGRSVQEVRASQQQVSEIAAGEGIEMRLDIARNGLTFDGHRLIHLAAEHGLDDAMKERLLHAYFCEGALIADRDGLVAMAVEIGLDAGEARSMLDGDRFADEVRADEQIAHQIGINGVPTFVVDRRIGVSGANPPEQLLALLRQGWEDQASASSPSSSGSSPSA